MSVNLKPGDHVFLKHKDGFTYEGDIKKVEEAVEMLTLYNIILLPRQSEIEGFRKFDFREILEIKRWVPDDPVPAGSETICSDETPPDELPTNSLKISEDEYNNIIRLQKEFRYLKACDNNFYEAVNILKQSSKIGICMKDVSKGRLRRGSVFAVSSNDHIFIFDIEVAGDRMFDKGLREILESKDIVKIVYDCRLLSDCLLTKHIVDLENVMDVEANDILLVYYDRGIVRKHTRSLNYLIDLYLGIPNAVVDDEQFQDSWTERPLEVKNQVLVAAYVSYLIPLQKSIEECYMQKMKQISALFNNHWKKGEEIFSAGTGSKYTPYFEIKELVRKNAEIRGKRRSHKDQENGN